MTEARGSSLTALVTGASTGIGRACALRLDALGHRVFAGIRSQSAAEDIASTASTRLTPVTLDVTSARDRALVAERLAADLGDRGLDVLINNAGVVVFGPMEHVEVDALRHQFDVNVFGHVSVTQAVLPMLRHAAGRRRARIINISSISGRVVLPFGGPYASSKFALEAISDAMRMELRAHGIDVVLIEPGAIDTPIWSKGKSDLATLLDDAGPDLLEHYGQAVEKAQRTIEQCAQNAIAVDAVVDAVVKAIIARRPPARRVVGADARMGVMMRRLLPDRFLDRLLARRMGLR